MALVAAALVVYTILSFNVSALPDPGWLETSLATSAKHWYVARAARAKLPTAPPDNGQNVASGQALFGMACASCHGQDARTPTPMGQSMYPRATDLAAPAIQAYTNRELFWVIKNGIRLSGMPGFARTNSDEQIWQLVDYVRSLGNPPAPRR